VRVTVTEDEEQQAMSHERSAGTVVALAVAGSLAAVVASSGPATAAPPPAPATLACGETGPVAVNTNKGNAFRVVGTNQNFVIMSGSLVDEDGTTTVIQAPNGTSQTRDIVTCTYTAPITSRRLQVSGFFTPAV
jgi:hypothetical protein